MSKRPFTSALSGQEFWLVVDKGYIPLGLVLGNCVYSMGSLTGWMANIKGSFRGEVSDVSKLMYEAREIALNRMETEAEALGADGVVGVDLKIEYLHAGEWMEVTAVGTAIKYVGEAAGDRGSAQVVLDVSETAQRPLRRPELP